MNRLRELQELRYAGDEDVAEIVDAEIALTIPDPEIELAIYDEIADDVLSRQAFVTNPVENVSIEELADDAGF